MVIAAAKTMQFHGSAQLEESSTKDTTGTALEYEIVGKSYEITGSALILTPNDDLIVGQNSANSLASMENYLQNTLLRWKICLMSGEHNRTVVETIAEGQCKCTQLQMQGQNKQNAQYSYTLTGYGPFTIVAAPSNSVSGGRSASTSGTSGTTTTGDK